MDQLQASLQAFIDSPSGIAIKGLLVAALLTFVLGVFAALRDGTFQWKYIDSFVRSVIWGRVAPVTAVLLGGYYLDPSGVVTATAVVVASAVAVGMLASIAESIKQIGSSPEKSAALNEPPKS